MPNQERFPVLRNFPLVFCFLLLAIPSAAAGAQTDADKSFYGRVNTFGVFVAYSPDSSHILLGDAENRTLLNVGVSYSRRLFRNHVVNWQYDGELLPVALESDPLGELTVNQTTPAPSTLTSPYGPVVDCAPENAQYSFTLPNGLTYSGTETLVCSGRQWTVGEGMSPVGFQWNFMPRRKSQPFFIGHGGYMYSTRPIPIDGAGSFNFTFDLGAGLEFYRSHTRSIRGELRYHHISNHETANANPGIDNLLYQVSYTFGR